MTKGKSNKMSMWQYVSIWPGSRPLCILVSIFTFCACMYLSMSFAPDRALHLPAPNIFHWSTLCPFCLHLLCLSTHLWAYLIISIAILHQYLDQPPHYPKYLDQLSAVLLATCTTISLVFARQSKQGVGTNCFILNILINSQRFACNLDNV